ncbi:MAG: hypothetical protein IKC08_03140 [Lentisphaeria bacterium]|nr:hypothetical protein [Lentisphaeria bacterium]
MNDLVWLKRESWEDLFRLLKNIQIRMNPAVSVPAVNFTSTGQNSRIFLDLPDSSDAYYGYFKVIKGEKNDSFIICDGMSLSSEIAGYAYINGVYTEIKAATVPLDEEKLTDGIITLPDGKKKEVKEGYISLALDPEGKVFFALTPQIIKRIYTGEFSVEYNHKEDQLVIVDGSDAKSQYAGFIFRNGEYYHVPAGSLELAEGTLCLVLDSSGEVSYKIVKQPAMRTYDGEFTVQYDPESGLIEVFDGTYGTGNAGHVFLDGKWTSVSAASIIPKEGYLCLRYSAEEGVTFSIVDKPAIKLERWEKPAEAPEEETEEKKG